MLWQVILKAEGFMEVLDSHRRKEGLIFQSQMLPLKSAQPKNRYTVSHFRFIAISWLSIFVNHRNEAVHFPLNGIGTLSSDLEHTP